MKKLLALTLTVIMALSLFVMPAYAEAELPAFTDVYAGQQTITFKLAQASDATELTAEQAALVKITRMDTGAEIGFTNKITGDILTIMANDGFVINDADSGEKVSYLLEIGNIKKTFSVNKIWEDTLDKEETSTLRMASATDVVHLVDGKMVLSGAQTAIYPNESTYVSKENVSFSFKLQTLAPTTSYGVVFNVNASTLRGDLYNTGWIHSTHFGWWNYCQQYAGNRNTNRRASAIIVDTNKVMQNVAVSWNNTYANNFELARPTEEKYDKASNEIDAEYGDTNTATLTIDKMGNVATFVQEGILYGETESTKGIVDVWNIADAYKASGNDAIAAATPVKTGHFAITRRYADNFVAISDMILTETNIADYVEPINPVDIYAGVKTLTLKYSEDINVGNMGEISVNDTDGNAVAFTPSFDGKILTLSFTDRIDITKDYVLTVNGKKYVFNYSVIWDADIKNSGLTKIKANKGNGLHIHTVAEENALITRGNHGYLVPNFDTTTYENLSVVFDAYYLGSSNGPRSFVGFNVNSNSQRWLESSTTANFFAWYTTTDSDDHKHRYNIPYTDSTGTANKVNSSTELPDASYSTALANGTNTVEYTDTDTTSGNTRGTAVITANTEPLLSYTVDKMGEIGTLSINSQLVDVWNTAEIYASNDAIKNETVSKKGYIYVASFGDGYNSAMYIKDWKIVTSSMREYEVGSFNATDVFADKDKMTVTFDSNIEKADLSKVILTQADGSVVECSKVATDNELIITPNGGFVLDRVYNITITEEFGYDAVLVSERYSKDFRINKIKEITFDDGETYAENGIDIKSYGGTPAATIRNGKLYVQDAYYSTIYIRNAVDTVENYRVNFTMQRYAGSWYNTTNLMFNAGQGTTLSYGNGAPVFGWLMKGNNSTMYRDYRHSGYKTGSDTYRTVVEGGFIPKASATDVTFTANAEKGDYDVTLPATDAKVHNYQLDKTGTKGALTVDGTLIDTFETKDVYKNWNAMQTDESKKLESEIVPSKGDLLIAGYNTSGETKGTIAIGTITFTSFEIIENTIEIVNVTYFDEKGNVLETIKDATGVKGEVSVKSYFNGKKPLALIAVAYSGDEMLAADVLDINEVEGAATASATYSLSGLKGLTEIKVLAWESFATLYPYAAAFTK